MFNIYLDLDDFEQVQNMSTEFSILYMSLYRKLLDCTVYKDSVYIYFSENEERKYCEAHILQHAWS